MRAAKPTRAELLARRESTLVAGGPTKADLWVSRLRDGTRVVVKEFADKPWPLRLWCRVQISREIRILERLTGLPHVPRLIGRLGRDGFVMSHFAGTPLNEVEDRPGRQQVIARLSDAIERIHASDVVHLDLRARDNVACEESGDVLIFDWAAALHLPPGSWRHRLLFALLCVIDRSALLKWKLKLAPESVSATERAFQRRFLVWRRLWPLNRKGLGQIR